MNEQVEARGKLAKRIEARIGVHPFIPLAILFGLNAVDELDRVAFGVLLPEIRDAFGLGTGGILNLVAVVSSLALLGGVFIGYWVDRAPRVKLALGGAAAWMVFSALTGLAPVVGVLLIARIGSALGKAVSDPVHQTLLSDYYEPVQRTKAFYYHRIANNTGQLAGPIIAGLLALYFGWRAPFIVFAVPTAILVVMGVSRLREPVRGFHERVAAGASDDLANTEDKPPSFAEAWKAAHQVKTLKRIYMSLPFFGASLAGLAGLYSLYYEDVFGLNEATRGVLATIAEVPQIFGAVIGVRIGLKVVGEAPGKLLTVMAGAAFVIGGGILMVAFAPVLVVAVLGNMIASGAGAVITGGIGLSVSLVIPPRIRGVGFGIFSLYALPGVAIILPAVGAIADSAGIRVGIALMVPVFMVGAFILASAGPMMDKDILRVRTQALAQAEIEAARQRGEVELLVTRGLDVSYGSTQVLFGVDFTCREGEIVALLGTNGAGKSTLLNAISGLVEPSGGAILFEGRDITALPANRTVAEGIVTVPGGKGVFPTLTVRENLALAGWLFNKEKEHVDAATAKVLEYFPILKQRWEEKAGNMSGGEQQMLTLGQAFIAKPKLLMIDELSLGLAPVIVEQLLEIVRAIHAQGTTIILVEQSVNVAITVAERAVFMEKGEIRFDGPSSDLLDRPDVLRAVFLQGAAAAGPDQDVLEADPRLVPAKDTIRQERLDREPVILQTKGLSVSFGGIKAVSDVDFDLRKGEIVGLIGPNGAGKTTIMDLISGFLVPSSGRVYLKGKDVTELTPDGRAWLGLGRSFQDARLFPALTVAETLGVALERHVPLPATLPAALVSPGVKVSEKAVAERVEELIELMHLQAFANKFISELSTGSRRIVDLACALAHGPDVLLLDEPSSGIAQKETEALGPVLMDIRDGTGAAILVIEHDMPLIQGVSDRLVALETGFVVTSGTPTEVINHPRVVESYLGGTDEVINRSGTSNGSKPKTKAKADKAPAKRQRGERLVAGR
jgi:ABC-type branched-subunit amino acid transport system ATPase component